MVDIIVVTYNAKDKLRKCLESVERYTTGTNYLLTVVNNHSMDGTLEFLKSYKKNNLQIFNTKKNLGFSGGANLALRNTHNRFITLLDDDSEVARGWLNKLYQQIRNRPDVGIVGPKVVFPDKTIFSADYRVRLFQLIGFGEVDRGQRDYVRECDALVGSCWLMRRKVIEKAGYFDERFFPSQHEDVDYCLRVRLAGYKIIYNGKADIVHHHLFRDGEMFNKNGLTFLKKWEDLFREYPFKDSHPADKHITYGLDHIKNRRFVQALSEFTEAEAIDRRFSEPLYMGLALEGLERFDEAIIEFKKLLILNPKSFEAHYNLALLYKKIGLFEKARTESDKAINILCSFKHDRTFFFK